MHLSYLLLSLLPLATALPLLPPPTNLTLTPRTLPSPAAASIRFFYDPLCTVPGLLTTVGAAPQGQQHLVPGMYGAQSAMFLTHGDLSDWWIQATASGNPIKTDKPDVNLCVAYPQGVYAGGYISMVDLMKVRGGGCGVICFVRRWVGV
ncbi:hypothetical protein MMC30_003935 [Trapelia coarctata]|nr:hypothetical protein [Trapelia coarctata]